MPSALFSRPFTLPGSGLSLGITIPPLPARKGVAMFHSSKFHLDQVDESYSQHLRAALAISLRLAAASAACALHALVPGLCTRSASRRIAELNARLAKRADTFDRIRPNDARFDRPRTTHVEIESS